jgi:chemotaxis family two-component system sensor kinase Cph1
MRFCPFHSTNLASSFPPWARHNAMASGLLAVFISPDRSDLLLWFRPEEPHFVNWGGNPQKDQAEGSAILPRQSFERWVETRRGFAKLACRHPPVAEPAG